MPSYSNPHSEEWFAALQKFNPQQAAMTSRIIALAGRIDVCSICGDEPSTVYTLNDPNIDETAVATIRLCEDCREIQDADWQ